MAWLLRPIFGTLVVLSFQLTSASPAFAEKIFGLTLNNRIVTFDSLHPKVIKSSGAILGLAAGEHLTGIDLRASDHGLYSVGTSGALYKLTGGPGAGYKATLVGSAGVAISGKRWDIDFNPVSDFLRFSSDVDQNLRIDPTSGFAIVDGAIHGPGNQNLNMVGVAYTNNRAGTLTTVLYGIDALTNTLFRSTDGNAGTFTNLSTDGLAFGPLGFKVGAEGGVGFDISGGSGIAYLSRSTGLYRVDLIRGHATLLGQPGLLAGIAAGSVPEPSIWAMALIGFGVVGAAVRSKRSARTVFA